jgi:hypothetical protein
VTVLLLAFMLAPGQGGIRTPPKDFSALFNGKDFTNWRGRQPNYDPKAEAALSKDERAAKQAGWNTARDAHWRVDTDKQEIVSDGQSPHLATVKDYGDFELYVDWLMVSHNGDSGIYLRGSPQVQIWDPDNPREVRNGAPKDPARCRTTIQTTRDVAARQGRQSGRRVEHVPRQDDRLEGVGLAQRQGHRRRPGDGQLLRPHDAGGASGPIEAPDPRLRDPVPERLHQEIKEGR